MTKAPTPDHYYKTKAGGFTLIEVLTATAILSVIILACISSVSTMQRAYSQSKNKVEQFREARIAFEMISQHLSQATLANYWDYYYPATKSNVPPVGEPVAPAAYTRHSDLHFISGRAADILEGVVPSADTTGHSIFFQAPLGLTQAGGSLGSLLNARGYAIQLLSDEAHRPPFISPQMVAVKNRWRLVEFRPPAERGPGDTGWNAVFERPGTWFRDGLGTSRRVVADNILLLLFSPQTSRGAGTTLEQAVAIAPDYHYDSRDTDNSTRALNDLVVLADGSVEQGTQHLLPPLVRVTLVAADETSIQRWMERIRKDAPNLLEEAGVTFERAASYESDIAALETYLNEQQLHYHIFSSLVSLRNARWDTR